MDDFFMREGWLQKKGVEGLKSWSKRYFTLEDEELYYYENKGDVAPKGRILLTDIQRVDSVSGGFFSRGYYFNAVTKDRTYELCAEDDNDRKEWISILQRASAHFKKMAKEAPVNTNETYDASDMNMNDDEEHVELTEEDMNDPDLLGELTELHGKEGLIEHLKELSAKIDSDKQKCIQFRDAGNIEEAKKLLLKVKNLQKQKESLELKIQNYDKQEEELEEEVTEEPQEEEEPVEEEQAEEEDMPSHDDTKSSATEESLVEVERRIEGFKNLALNAKKQGNIAQATQYMKSYKVLLQAKEQLDVGIQMDLSKLPNLDPALPSTTSTTTTPTSAPSSSSRPKSNSVTPPPTKNVEAERLEALSILEEELRRQYEVAKTKALAAKEKGDKHTALEQLNITKDVKHHLEEIIKAKSLPHVPVPKYHFEMKEHTIEKKHDDLLDNEIEITILNCKGIKDPAITSPYYHVLFPYPNSEDPQKSSSSSFSVSKSADFQHTCKMTIERKKSFQIFCERKKIFVELYQSRLLLSSVLLGKGELKMSTLLEKCETKETIEIKNGRKLICVVDVSVRLKKPVVKQQHIDKIVEKVLVIDEHYTSAPPPAETPKEAPVVETPKVKVPEPVKKEPEPSKKEEEPTPSTEDDYLSVDYLISNDVLEFERDLLAAKISALKGQAPDELVDRKQAIELKLQILSVQASTGQLDQEKYIQDMRDKIVVEKKLAGRLSKEGNKEAALMAMKRVKIMEKEIEASLE